MAQSLAAVRLGGLITVVGFVGGPAQQQPPPLTDCLASLCTVRGILVGSRAQMEDMCRAVEADPDRLRPVLDAKRFRLEELKEAYEYQRSGKHFGKICIDIS